MARDIAMQHFSGPAVGVARVSLGEDKRGCLRQEQARASQNGAAVGLDEGTSTTAPPCEPSAPVDDRTEQRNLECARKIRCAVAISHNGATPRG